MPDVSSEGWFCGTCGWTPWNGEDEVFTAEQVRRLMGEREAAS